MILPEFTKCVISGHDYKHIKDLNQNGTEYLAQCQKCNKIIKLYIRGKSL